MNRYVFLIMALCFSLSVSGQDIFGKWRTIDDETGEAKSIVEIYEKDGKVYGKIIQLLRSKDDGALCTKCDGEDYNRPVLGFVLIKNLTREGEYYRNGTIFDPERGKRYKCRIALDDDDPNVLEVRGYIAFLYATQYWERITS